MPKPPLLIQLFLSGSQREPHQSHQNQRVAIESLIRNVFYLLQTDKKGGLPKRAIDCVKCSSEQSYPVKWHGEEKDAL